MTEYDKLVTKVDNSDTTGFVLKTTYDTDKSDLERKISDAEKKIPNTSDLDKNTDLHAKITEIENKIPSITGLATNSALTAFENKTPNVSGLVKKQIMIQKYQIFKRKLLIIIMTNILLPQNLIN